MRIAHVTDIHWQLAPSIPELMSPKRALGTANLYLRGRRHHFQPAVQDALMEHLLAIEPDCVAVTGDLTATALHSEFELAKAKLAPVAARFPMFVIPGNHDVYTPSAQQERRVQGHFGDWMHLRDGGIGRLDVGEITCLGLDPNKPHLLLSNGVVPQAQLEALASILEGDDLAQRQVVLCLHYPILDRHGEVYDGKNHGLLNALELIGVLERATHKPALILHGHEHHGFAVDLDLGEVKVPIRNCGSSGYAWEPERRRAAGMCVYHVGDGLERTERFLFDGESFSPEPGGAYATGR